MLAQEREARHEARLASTSHQQQQQQQPAIQSGYFPHSVGSSNQTMSKNTKKKKKKKNKKKNKNKGKQNAGQDSSIKTSGGAVATSALDEMAYLDAMVAENQAAAKKRNKPKNWVKAEAQKWRINSDGVLSGSRGGTLTARERHDKARLLRNKIAKSQSGRGTTKTKKIQKK